MLKMDDGSTIKTAFFCHGDNLDGAGHFAHGFNPPPANFQDPGIIPNFRETFLFWRISKGGPGLPASGNTLGFGNAGLGGLLNRRRNLGCHPLSI